MHVAAPVSRVWELVTDIALPARLSPELYRVAWLDGAERAAPYARFEGFNRNDVLGEWRTVSYVVELVEPRVFAWAVTDADGRYGAPTSDPARPMATWRYELAPEDGGTRLHQSVVLGPARSGVDLAIDRWPDRAEQIVATRLADLRAAMATTLDGIAALARH